MFTQTSGGVSGKKLEFYGNDGVCLFKYFVTPDDPQKLFTWMVLFINFICFILISVCYVVINIAVTNSSKRSASTKSKGSKAKNTRLQRNVSLMIITDFLCWVPSMIICGLHYLEVVNATPWYALFSIIVIPIYSVINPILYDTSGIFSYILSFRKTVSANVSSRFISYNNNTDLNAGTELQAISRKD